jgi:Tfp pilus assembly protein FimT
MTYHQRQAPISRREKAFSLPELLVVIVIVMIASTVSLVAYANYRREASVRSSAESVKSLLVEARTRAIADNLPVAVAFDLTNQVMWVDELESDLSIRRPKVVAPEYFPVDTVLEEVRINSAAFTTDIRRVVFRPDGSNPLVTIILRRERAETGGDTNYYTVQMYPASPEPRVLPNERR